MNIKNTSKLTGFAEKYVNRYNGTSSDRETNYNDNSSKYGDAVYETSNAGTGSGAWYGDYSTFVSPGAPFFKRGGYCNGANYAGAFAFDLFYGSSYGDLRFSPSPCSVVLSLA